MNALNKKIIILIVLVALFLLTFAMSLSFGQIQIPFLSIVNILTDQLNLPILTNAVPTAEDTAVVWHIRMQMCIRDSWG